MDEELETLTVRLAGDDSEYSEMLETAISSIDSLAAAIDDLAGTAEDRTTEALEGVGKGSEDAAEDMENLGDESEDVASRLEQAANRIEQFTSNVEGFASAAAQGLAAIGLGSGVKDMFDSFSEAEDVGIRLRAGLRANGREVETLMERYEAFAARIQETTRHDDEFALSLLQQAESFNLTGDAAERASEDAIALAAINGSNAQSMIRLTAAMAQGDTQRAMQFARMIPQLRGVKNESEFLAKYNSLITAGLTTASEQANTAAGKIARLNNEIGNLAEAFGGIVAEAILPFIDHIKNIVKWFQELDPAIQKVLVGVIALTSGVLALNAALPILRALAAPFLRMLSPIGLAIAAITALATLIINEMGGLDVVWERIKTGFNAFLEWAKPIWNALVHLGEAAWEAIKGIAIAMWETIKEAFNAAYEVISAIWTAIFGDAQISWEGTQQGFITAIQFMEFTIRNFGMVCEYVWTGIKYNFMVVVDFIKDAFIGLIAVAVANARAIAESFIAAWQAIRTGSLRPLGDLRNRIVRVWSDTFDRVSGAMGAGPSNLTRELGQQLEAQGNAIQSAFEEFQNQRYWEDWELGGDEAVDAASAAGARVGDAFSSGMAQEIKHADAALQFSAEAITRMQDYADRFTMAAEGANGGRGGGGGGGGMQAVGAGGGNANQRMEGWLSQIARNTGVTANRPPVEFEGADLDAF